MKWSHDCLSVKPKKRKVVLWLSLGRTLKTRNKDIFHSHSPTLFTKFLLYYVGERCYKYKFILTKIAISVNSFKTKQHGHEHLVTNLQYLKTLEQFWRTLGLHTYTGSANIRTTASKQIARGKKKKSTYIALGLGGLKLGFEEARAHEEDDDAKMTKNIVA